MANCVYNTRLHLCVSCVQRSKYENTENINLSEFSLYQMHNILKIALHFNIEIHSVLSILKKKSVKGLVFKKENINCYSKALEI